MLPKIELVGPPRAQGLTHGRAARAQIAHNLAVYFHRFGLEGLAPDAARARAASYLAFLEAGFPDYMRAVEGVAEGSGQPFLDVLLLNLRYEVIYDRFNANAVQAGDAAGADRLVDGCTAFAVLPEASIDGHLRLGQNWDWIPDVQGVLLHSPAAAADGPDGLASLCFTEAGIVGGKIGLNSAGVGLAINGLSTLEDSWARQATPFHVRCHAILRQRRLADAVAIAEAAPRACSANFLIGQAGHGAVDVETAPAATRALAPDAALLVHANHFADAAGMGIDETPHQRRPYSVCRADRLSALLDRARPVTLAAIQSALRDHDKHPYSVCRHADLAAPPDDRFSTVSSIVMDLDAGRMWATDGPPCEAAYVEHAL
jgi:isopenicillin-N N-acyltransferase-like protein